MNRPDGHCGAVNSSNGLRGQRFGTLGQAQPADDLVAAATPATARVRVAPTLVLIAVDGVGLDARPDMGDDLLGQAAVGRGERLPFALRRIARLGEGDALDPRGRLVRGEQVGDLGLERDSERVLLERRLVAAMGRWPIVEAGLVAERRRARPGDPNGFGGDPVGLRRRQHVRGGEAPCPVDQDWDAEPLALSGRHALDASGLDRDALLRRRTLRTSA